MAATPTSRRRSSPAGMQPLSPQRKWLAITVATLLLVPAFWALLAGLVAAADDAADTDAAPNVAIALAVGLAVVPFVFVALAFLSEHPRAPGAVLRAMGWSLLVGIPVSALAGDAVTGIVAGVGAGGIQALRMDEPQNWRARALGVVVAAAYTLVLARLAGGLVLLPAPIFPLTAIGVADHLSERRAEQDAARGSDPGR
ncbi:MAG TPA: hypothetical protein VKD21_16160 [Acidimicrobiales bacterium]|nr:hypothetical protein [Acidimicrobiales bacterium]